MLELFDTHAHLLDDRFDEDRAQLAAALPGRGIRYLLEACIAATLAPRVMEFVNQYPYMFAALGTHPHDASDMRAAHIPLLKSLLASPKAVAVGEIGLDYHYDFSPRDVQRSWFDAQLALAGEVDLPVVLHVREATEDALALLRAHKNTLRGVMHCFSGSYETAKSCLDMGLYIAFGGALTFKTAAKSVEIAQKLPLERLLIETDCPYMTPVPYRAKRNDPSLVALVCEKLAEIKGISAAEVAVITLQNGKDIFHISE